jgi:anthranilate synthase component 1
VQPPFERSSADAARASGLAFAVWPLDLATPVQLFLALRASGHKPCLLESVEGPARLARYSFLGVDPAASLRASKGSATLSSNGVTSVLHGAAHVVLREALGRFALPRAPHALPPFAAGWVGYFTYEWAAALEPTVPRAAHDPRQLAEASIELYRDVFALDHAAQRLYVMTHCDGSERDHARAQEHIAALAAQALDQAARCGGLMLAPNFVPAMERARFTDGVRSLQTAIRQGECFQAVLSQRFDLKAEGDPFALYRVLRITNPSPHMFFFEADGVTLIGSSPERLVSVRERRAETRPIAGTRPRGASPEEDESLALELSRDLKERAEHDMLVDLARNDLGRVARIGTVKVREHAALERFARVMHLVSRVDADLAADRDALDALAATFPAGTVSGAPKVRAMQLLAQLESDTRGPYAGCFGYVDGSGALDMALSIRTFTMRGTQLSVQAGAGIVADSDPDREYEETLHKAQALSDAARLAASPAFTSKSTEVAR